YDSVFVIVPTEEARHSEARRIAGEICFDSLQWKRRQFDHVSKNGLHSRFIEIVKDAVEVGSLCDVSPTLRFAKVRHEATTRERAVHLEHGREQHVREWEAALSASSLRRRLEVAA